MAFPIVAGAIAGAGALLKGITGISQRRQARRIEKNNPFPTMQLQDEFVNNATITNNMARLGLPSEQYNQAQTGIARNMTGAMRLLSRSQNPVAGLTYMLRAGNDAQISLDVNDANARQQNQRFAIQQNSILGQQKNQVWDWNKRQNFLMKLSQSQALRGAGTQNLMGAFNDITSMGALMAMNGVGSGSGSPGAGIQPMPSTQSMGATNPMGVLGNRNSSIMQLRQLPDGSWGY